MKRAENLAFSAPYCDETFSATSYIINYSLPPEKQTKKFKTE